MKSIILALLMSIPTISSPYEVVVHIPLDEVVITAKRIQRSFKTVFFFGFKLLGDVKTVGISGSLKEAMDNYKGPKDAVTSVMRLNSFKSQHRVGKAIDFRFSEELICYLLSDEGQEWLTTYSITFYIEGRPGSSKVKSYESTAPKYVFYNPRATGDHIHLGF